MQAPMQNSPQIFINPDVLPSSSPASQQQRLPSFQSVAEDTKLFSPFQPYLQEPVDQQLSSYRSKRNPQLSLHELRAVANDRERRRTRDLNQAFEGLRKCIFAHSDSNTLIKKNLKCAKIVTLRLAAMHIDHLHRKLFNGSGPADDQIPEAISQQNYQLQPVMHSS